MPTVERSWPGGRVLIALAVVAIVVSAAAIALGGMLGADGRRATGRDRGSASATAATGASRARSAACGPTRGTFGPGRWPGGCWRPYGPHSPFNQRLPRRPRLARGSVAIVRRLLGFGPLQNAVIGTADTTEDFGHPFYFAHRYDPSYRLRCRGRYGRCPLDRHHVRIPRRARPASGRDAHLAVVNQRTGREDDLYEVAGRPRRGRVLRFTFGGATKIHGRGLRAGATAARFGLLAGIIRAAELARGEIRHALFMTVLCDNGRAVYPAAGVGRPCSAIGAPNAGAPPMGTRFQLALSSHAIAALRAPHWAKTILRAMARYGMFVGDTGGSSWGLQLESGTSYTSFGYTDPLISFARSARLPRYEGRYVLSLRRFVSQRNLRVIAPCVSSRRC